MKWYLHTISLSNGVKKEEKLYSLQTPGTYFLGRDEKCALHVEGNLVSRFHAKIVLSEDGGLSLVDMAVNSNGTFVNGLVLAGSDWPLEEKDQITLGAPYAGGLLLVASQKKSLDLDRTVQLKKGGAGGVMLIDCKLEGNVNIAEDDIVVAKPLAGVSDTKIPEEIIYDKKEAIGESERYKIQEYVAKFKNIPKEYKKYNITLGSSVATIWLYRNMATRKFMAGKMPQSDDRIEHFGALISEARILSHLDHRHIVKFHGLYQDNKVPVVLVDFINGPTLDKLDDLQKDLETNFPIQTKIRWIAEIANALSYMHKQGFCHRDIKPTNIILADDFADEKIAVLIDFDTARYDEKSRTSTGIAKGTLPYMAPELFANEEEKDREKRIKLYRKTDAYSIGATLYYMLRKTSPLVSSSDTIRNYHSCKDKVEYRKELAKQQQEELKKQDIDPLVCIRKTILNYHSSEDKVKYWKSLAEQWQQKLKKQDIDPYLRQTCVQQLCFDPQQRPKVEVLFRRLVLWMILHEEYPDWTDDDWQEIADNVLPWPKIRKPEDKNVDSAAMGFDLGKLGDWKKTVARALLRAAPPLWDGKMRPYSSLSEEEQSDSTVYRVPGPEKLNGFILAEISPQVQWAGEILLPARAVVCGGPTIDGEDIANYRELAENAPEDWLRVLAQLIVSIANSIQQLQKQEKKIENLQKNETNFKQDKVNLERQRKKLVDELERKKKEIIALQKEKETFLQNIDEIYKLWPSDARQETRKKANEQIIVTEEKPIDFGTTSGSDEYGLTDDIWKKYRYKHNGKWILDMTTDDWVKLSWQDQWKYAKAYQTDYAKSINKPVEQEIRAGETGFEMMLIPPGRFWMGSPEDEQERDGDEARHRVIISQAFWIQKTEITQGQWKAVMGKEKNPSYFKNAGDDAPVEKISWENVTKEFLPKLGKNWKNWNLPTEAEWEYACRAGTITPFNLGENINTDRVNYDGNYPYHNAKKGEYREKTVEVKSLANANAWGCYDFHGNVWEWCQDWYADYPNLEKDAVDPKGPTIGSVRVCRGGSWNSYARRLRSAYRIRYEPSYRNNYLGARLFFREAMP